VSDTLNAALGKLEYKTNLGVTAYDWYRSVTNEDTDDVINKWGEIVDFIDGIKEGSDILEKFVTIDTSQTITGSKTFTKPISTTNLSITGSVHPHIYGHGDILTLGGKND
jgi:hypothetical protein